MNGGGRTTTAIKPAKDTAGGRHAPPARRNSHSMVGGNQAHLRRLTAKGQPLEGAEAPSVVHETLAGPGAPLDTTTNALMSQGLGHDFSAVRVHTDAQAAASARAVDAHAYTVGADVVFGQGQYRPDTQAGRRLLAHELAHVAQQGAGAVVRRAPAPPVMYDTGTQSFRAPASSATLASIKADIAAKQAPNPNPDLGPSVDVKGVTAGAPEELYVWNVLEQRGQKANWGTEIQVVTDIGPTPATPAGATAPKGQITIIIDKAGNATAELLDRGAVAVPNAFPDKAKAIEALKTDFGFASVDDGTAPWTPGELNKVYAGLGQLPLADRAGLSGAALVRDVSLVDGAGKPVDGTFEQSHSATVGSPGAPAVASQASSLHLASGAFTADAAGFVGERGREMLPSLRIVLHEAGHAIESKALRDAQFATDTAQATANNDQLDFNAQNTGAGAAVTAANAAAHAADVSAQGYTRPDVAGARAFVMAFRAALTAINTFANNTVGSKFAALETAAQTAITARDAAKAKVPAGNPSLSDFAPAVAAQDAWFAAAQLRAKASLKLDASKADVTAKTKAQGAVSDASGGASKRLERFVAVVKKNKIAPVTQYAKDNWPGHPEEFFAEAYSLWLTNPGYLGDNAPALKAWFDAGEHLK